MGLKHDVIEIKGNDGIGKIAQKQLQEPCNGVWILDRGCQLHVFTLVVSLADFVDQPRLPTLSKQSLCVVMIRKIVDGLDDDLMR